MLRWRLLIGIPLVALLVLFCWLDAIAPAPGLVLMPFFLVCVFFLCREIMQLLNAGGIYPRRTTIYVGVFGTIVLSWIACCNSMPYIARFEHSIVDAFQNETVDSRGSGATVQEQDRAISEASRAVSTARRALEGAEKALETARERAAERKEQCHAETDDQCDKNRDEQ